ncbi:Iron transport multicopper oxidase fio1, partial [Dictyocoela muelleri]
GHHVWVLAQGETNQLYFNQTTFKQIIYNEKNPVYRDTFTVNPFSYLVFRFKANNPGIWMMHCHNEWHLQLGMALVFLESPHQIKDFYQKQNVTHLIPSQCQHQH